MFNALRSISNQELFKKHLYNPRILKERNGAVRPSYINYRLKSEVFIMLLCRPLHSSMNQELFEKHLCYQNSYYEKYG